ncbi:MAG TPA: hypothetical protein VFV34_28665 [Blastocatellia bacterium]|nr:hypothetical protein [Blastocatellia bacterium]
MAEEIKKKIEVFANIAIIVVALTGTAVLIKKHVFSSAKDATREVAQQNASHASGPPVPIRGVRLSLPGIMWGDRTETFVIALSTQCRFCGDGAPFYRQLVGKAARIRGVRVIAIFPQELEEARKYLEELDVSIPEVMQVKFDSIGLRATPALVLVDNTGEVKDSWAGVLTAERQGEVLARLKCD